MKYIVMEVKRSYAVLLDEDGRFVTAANLRYEVGQIVENPVLMIDSGDNQKKKKRLITGFAAVLTLLILLFAALFWYDSFTDSYASIYFSVNPQVEIEVNKSGPGDRPGRSQRRRRRPDRRLPVLGKKKNRSDRRSYRQSL